jgi:acyl carrier protein
LLDQIKEVFHEVFDVAMDMVTLSTTKENLSEWDSMKHMELIMFLENKFGIMLEVGDIVELVSVEKIIETISSKLKSTPK